jgi:DNA repair photolyase
MRWDNLLAETEGQETAALPLFPGEAVVRRFSTPQFRGMTFYEVAARSIINHVPGDRFGFNWTINPYRGCSHACSYCLAGETAILMGDGSTRALEDVAAGDTIYGTVEDDEGRHYVRTTVLRQWRTRKRAFRVALADGTELIASGDHRFLTDAGWRHVTPGLAKRPALTLDHRLVGTGRLGAGGAGGVSGGAGPGSGTDYQKGYLFGLVQGGGPQGVGGLVNLEALRRGRQYLDALGVGSGTSGTSSGRAGSSGASPGLAGSSGASPGLAGFGGSGSRGAAARRSGGLSALGTVGALGQTRPSPVALAIAPESSESWPDSTHSAWAAGFLGGMVDARAGASAGQPHIESDNPEVLEWACRSLEHLHLSFDLDRDHGQVVLTGGVADRLRFLQTIDPAVSRVRSIEGEAVPGGPGLRVVAVEPLGIEMPMVDITTGTGDFIAEGIVSHNCFARPTHTYLDFDAGEDFETKIVVKINAPALLRRELRRPTWKGQLIAMGTNTDPYQRAEGHYRLMRGILAELNAARNPYSILTKGTLIQRDLDLLREGAAVTDVSANFSVGTVDEEVWKRAEPGTPHPMKRLEVVRMLNDAGVPCGVLMAPILPGISDSPEQLAATVKAAAEAGATHITPITLHLRPGVKEEFLPWLAEHYPHLSPRYAKDYRRSYARKEIGEGIGRQVAELRRRHGITSTRVSGGRGPVEANTGPPGAPQGSAPGAPQGRAPGGPGGPGGSEVDDGQLALDLGADGPRRAPRRMAARQA